MRSENSLNQSHLQSEQRNIKGVGNFVQIKSIRSKILYYLQRAFNYLQCIRIYPPSQLIQIGKEIRNKNINRINLEETIRSERQINEKESRSVSYLNTNIDKKIKKYGEFYDLSYSERYNKLEFDMPTYLCRLEEEQEKYENTCLRELSRFIFCEGGEELNVLIDHKKETQVSLNKKKQWQLQKSQVKQINTPKRLIKKLNQILEMKRNQIQMKNKGQKENQNGEIYQQGGQNICRELESQQPENNQLPEEADSNNQVKVNEIKNFRVSNSFYENSEKQKEKDKDNNFGKQANQDIIKQAYATTGFKKQVNKKMGRQKGLQSYFQSTDLTLEAFPWQDNEKQSGIPENKHNQQNLGKIEEKISEKRKRKKN